MNGENKVIGLDTGFFVQLFDKKSQPVQKVWHDLITSDQEGFVSCLSLFELERLSLKGRIDKVKFRALMEFLSNVVTIIWNFDPAMISKASRISHGNGLASMDALILTALIQQGAKTIYTTDGDMKKYKYKDTKVILI